MEEERLKAILESLLFAAGEPVSLARLAAVLENVPKEAIRKALNEMATGFAGGRGLSLEQVAGGYQLRTHKEHALYVRKLLATKPPRLTRPLLETVAIIAYRQPITRPEIEQLRGVDTGGVLETLLERRLIKIAGRKEAPGRPMVYATTPEFLETFGLKDLESLPDISEFREVERSSELASELARETPEAQPETAPAHLELESTQNSAETTETPDMPQETPVLAEPHQTPPEESSPESGPRDDEPS